MADPASWISFDSDTSDAPTWAGPAVDILTISDDDFATQITLENWELFRRLEPEELRNGAWMKDDKQDRAPNVVALSSQFNSLSFWVTHEVVMTQEKEARANKIGHFIRIAKKLRELNNFHGLRAILAGLQSAPIYRLKQSWELVRTRERERFSKLELLASNADNFHEMRQALMSSKPPCIPYLGMYLTDLTHTAVAATKESAADRNHQCEDMIRFVLNFQRFEYHLMLNQPVSDYLKTLNHSADYMKFFERQHFECSQKLEPPPHASASTSDDSIADMRMALPQNKSATLLPSFGRPFSKRPRGHVKSRSLGSATALWGSSDNLLFSPDKASISSGSSSLRSPSTPRHSSLRTASHIPITLDLNRLSDSDSDCEEHDTEHRSSLDKTFDDWLGECPTMFEIEGQLRRKRQMRLGADRSVWAGVSGDQLFLFRRRSKKQAGRQGFQDSPSAVVPLIGSTVVLEESRRPTWALHLTDGFILITPPTPLSFVVVSHVSRSPFLPPWPYNLSSLGRTLRFATNDDRDRDRWVAAFEAASTPQSCATSPRFEASMAKAAPTTRSARV
eukprot:m.49989 g.49989  ORF g.49989 m.49989 type:complete len:563 (-) comp6506_c1_seq1:341-2029(-)